LLHRVDLQESCKHTLTKFYPEGPGNKDPLPEYSEGDGSIPSTTLGKVHIDLSCNIDT